MTNKIEEWFDYTLNQIPKDLQESDELVSIREGLRNSDYLTSFHKLYEFVLVESISSDSLRWIVNGLRVLAEELDILDKVTELKDYITRLIQKTPPVKLETFDIIASIKFQKSQLNGRVSPVISGYRAPIYFTESGSSATFDFVPNCVVFPGQSSDAKIKFSIPEQYIAGLEQGQKFYIKEGSTIVGEGTITVIENNQLIKTKTGHNISYPPAGS